MISEFYMLRRTAIKDISAYLGFLAGFIGSAPFAWGLLAEQLDLGRFARGLWYFFGIVTAAGIFAGIAGLGIGIALGMIWEQVHRHRRNARQASVSVAEAGEVPRVVNAERATARPVPLPRLKLVQPANRETRTAMRSESIKNVSFRDLILAVIMIGITGLIVELALLEHTESWQQWIPLALLIGGLLVTPFVRISPSPGSFLAFRAVMVMFLAAGVLGLYFHYQGNVEFLIERTPELSGLPLIWKALRGATPTLAPGALVQLGLLGLAYAYRHPSVNRLEKSHNGE